MPLIRSNSLPNLSLNANHFSKELRKTASQFCLTKIQNAHENLQTNLPPQLETDLIKGSNVVGSLTGASACAMPSTSSTLEKNCFSVYIDVLQKSNLSKNKKKGAINGIKLFKNVQDNWNAISNKLKNPNHTSAKKIRWFTKLTDLSVHPKTEIDFILGQFPIIFEQSQLNMNSWKNDLSLLCQRFNSDMPCLEGRHKTFFSNLYEKKKGEKLKIDIKKNKIDNFLSYLNTYCIELEQGDDPAKFREWFIRQEGSMENETSEGKITLDELNKFIIFSDKELVMLRKEESEK